jgi:signal transduction histidine kinase
VTAASRLFRTSAFRLSLLYIAVFGTAAALAIAYIYWNTSGLLERQLEGRIQAEIRGLAEQYRAGGISQLTRIVADRSRREGDELYLVTNRNGRYVAGNLTSVSPDLWNSVGQIEFVYSRPGKSGPKKRLALANVFRLRDGYRLIVGRDIEDRRKFQNVIWRAFFIGLGVIALFGIVGGIFVSRSLLARIEEVNATSRTIMSGDLTGRIPVSDADDEIDRLAENLNVMLDRIEQLMEGLREVSDNIAHDLKTPLNRLRNRIEGALRQGGGEGAYRDALERTIEEADDLIKTFNALLSIARLEAGAVGESMEDVEISQLIQDVAELYEPVAEERGVELTTRIPSGITMRADRQLLGQALTNLIDNAFKYGVSKRPKDGSEMAPSISIAAKKIAGRVEIGVADHGPGIPEADRERVLERFVRLEESRTPPGSGLGLSLVAAVAHLHGGDVRLESNEPGLRVVLSLPIKTGSTAKPVA